MISPGVCNVANDSASKHRVSHPSADEAHCESRTIHVVIDTETTGLGHIRGRNDGIIQVGIAYRDPTGNVRTWSSICMPDEEYFLDGRADYALEINRLSLDELKLADSDVVVAKRLEDELNSIAENFNCKIKLYAYNRGFDRTFLSISPWNFGSWDWGDCIMVEIADLHNYGRWMKLVNAFQLFFSDDDELLANAHDAAADAHMALLVAEKANMWEVDC